MPRPVPAVFTVDWNACIKCGACVAVCPQGPGFITPFDTIAVNEPCGVACMLCEAICPTTAIAHERTPHLVPTDPLSA